MTTKITYEHFCNLGALGNPHCFSRFNDRIKDFEYYYFGNLSEACYINKTRNISSIIECPPTVK